MTEARKDISNVKSMEMKRGGLLTRVKYSSTWACEVVGLLIVAYIFNVVECQVKDQDLDNA